jgi:hypothetical protein
VDVGFGTDVEPITIRPTGGEGSLALIMVRK